MEIGKTSVDSPSRRALKHLGLVLFAGAFIASALWAVTSPTPESITVALSSAAVFIWKLLQI